MSISTVEEKTNVFLEQFKQAIEKSDIKPEQLEFEITEDFLKKDLNKSMNILNELNLSRNENIVGINPNPIPMKRI